MSEGGARRDPFTPTVDPERWVPWQAGERALQELERAVLGGSAVVCLRGPAGCGRSTLLAQLARRLRGRLTAVQLPYAALEPAELARVALGLLGLDLGQDPEAQLVATSWMLRRRGSALLLLLDDADAMPLETARRLRAMAEASEGSLRPVVVLGRERNLTSLLEALRPIEVALAAGLRPEETEQILRCRLDAAGAPPEVVARFDRTAVEALHRLSAGNPRRLETAAAAYLRTGRLPGSGDEAGPAAAAGAGPPSSEAARAGGTPQLEAGIREPAVARASPGAPIDAGPGGREPSPAARASPAPPGAAEETTSPGTLAPARASGSPGPEQAAPEARSADTGSVPGTAASGPAAAEGLRAAEPTASESPSREGASASGLEAAQEARRGGPDAADEPGAPVLSVGEGASPDRAAAPPRAAAKAPPGEDTPPPAPSPAEPGSQGLRGESSPPPEIAAVPDGAPGRAGPAEGGPPAEPAEPRSIRPTFPTAPAPESPGAGEPVSQAASQAAPVSAAVLPESPFRDQVHARGGLPAPGGGREGDGRAPARPPASPPAPEPPEGHSGRREPPADQRVSVSVPVSDGAAARDGASASAGAGSETTGAPHARAPSEPPRRLAPTPEVAGAPGRGTRRPGSPPASASGGVAPAAKDRTGRGTPGSAGGSGAAAREREGARVLRRPPPRRLDPMPPLWQLAGGLALVLLAAVAVPIVPELGTGEAPLPPPALRERVGALLGLGEDASEAERADGSGEAAAPAPAPLEVARAEPRPAPAGSDLPADASPTPGSGRFPPVPEPPPGPAPVPGRAGVEPGGPGPAATSGLPAAEEDRGGGSLAAAEAAEGLGRPASPPAPEEPRPAEPGAGEVARDRTRDLPPVTVAEPAPAAATDRPGGMGRERSGEVSGRAAAGAVAAVVREPGPGGKATADPADAPMHLARVEPAARAPAPSATARPRGPEGPRAEPALRQEAALPPAPQPVLIAINAIPWAVIEIDGEEIGETPLARIPLLPGRHRFVARFPDGRVVVRDAEVDAEHRRFVFE